MAATVKQHELLHNAVANTQNPFWVGNGTRVDQNPDKYTVLVKKKNCSESDPNCFTENVIVCRDDIDLHGNVNVEHRNRDFFWDYRE